MRGNRAVRCVKPGHDGAQEGDKLSRCDRSAHERHGEETAVDFSLGKSGCQAGGCPLAFAPFHLRAGVRVVE
jgi:hypothetical protein